MKNKFVLKSEFKPTGDQPEAIEKLVSGFLSGKKKETLVGVTGSGKTFTMANVIEKLQRPTLVISHNKTLASQLYGELKEFFPENRVEYYVSYYDYYQPEAYVPSTDTYIDKDSSVNDEIDKLRHSATAALCEKRSDVIVVASVSCIYGLGSPMDYEKMTLTIRLRDALSYENVIKKLIDIQYVRNEIDFKRGTFRVKGDTIDIFPIANNDDYYRIVFDFDTIEKILHIDYVTSNILDELNFVTIFPATQYVIDKEKMDMILDNMTKDMEIQVKRFTDNKKFVEAERLSERTRYDIEMLRETGYCNGIENYERYLNFQKPGEPPYTLMDYFPKDFLCIVDESHITLPQLRGMYNGNLSRKQTLVNYGFRLESALDNRPLNFSEWSKKIDKILFVSATPNEYEKSEEELRAEQLIRPTGLLDPEIVVKPTKGQIDDIIAEINKTIEKKEKVMITTLTKKMAEDLTSYLKKADIRVEYLHSDIDTLDRAKIIRDLRTDKFDVLVGINLLREGLDIPEISLVCILDADKEGFLRSEISLIQTVGRASRNVSGHVIMYADTITNSMKVCIDETNRRREIQKKYNEEHNITPKTIQKKVRDLISVVKSCDDIQYGIKKDYESMNSKELEKVIKKLTKRMHECAVELNFEEAKELRDKIYDLKKYMQK